MDSNGEKKPSSDINEAAKGLSMVLQIGINMIVPVALCLFIGYKLDAWLHTNYMMIIFIFLGFAAGIRSVYAITRSFYASDLKKEKEAQKYFDDLYRERKKNASDDYNDDNDYDDEDAP